MQDVTIPIFTNYDDKQGVTKSRPPGASRGGEGDPEVSGERFGSGVPFPVILKGGRGDPSLVQLSLS